MDDNNIIVFLNDCGIIRDAGSYTEVSEIKAIYQFWYNWKNGNTPVSKIRSPFSSISTMYKIKLIGSKSYFCDMKVPKEVFINILNKYDKDPNLDGITKKYQISIPRNVFQKIDRFDKERVMKLIGLGLAKLIDAPNKRKIKETEKYPKIKI